MDNRVLRYGIDGSGYAARFHFKALNRIFGVRVVIEGAYSQNREHLEQFTAERGIKAFQSIDELISQVDVVHICTPPSAHEPIVILAKD